VHETQIIILLHSFADRRNARPTENVTRIACLKSGFVDKVDTMEANRPW